MSSSDEEGISELAQWRACANAQAEPSKCACSGICFCRCEQQRQQALRMAAASWSGYQPQSSPNLAAEKRAADPSATETCKRNRRTLS